MSTLFLVDGPIAEMLQRGDIAQAASTAQAAVSQNPGDLSAINGLAMVRLQQGRTSEAREILALGVRLNPQWALGHHNAGEIERALGNLRPALEHFQRAIDADPNLAAAHFAYAETARHIGDQTLFAPAQQHFAEAARLRPDWPEAHCLLGTMLLYSSKEREAEEALRRALDLRPEYPAAQHQLANALMEQGRVEEALPLLEAVVKAAPHLAEPQRDLKRLQQLRTRKPKERLARYPRSQREFADVQRIIDEYILPEYRDAPQLIGLKSRVFTLGSCFAGNIARKLVACGVNAEHVVMAEELNSTYANRYFLEWIREPQSGSYAQRFESVFGSEYSRHVQQLVRDADLVIYSLGVAPCFFDRETGEFVLTLGENLHAALLAKQFAFRTTSVAENVANIARMIDLLREINPRCQVMLTVSPVPLKATFERSSAIVADCVSKSTLRVVAHEIMQMQLPMVHYWPSYEIVKWIGCHTGPVFGVDDESPLHPSDELVRTIIASFLRVYGDEEVNAASGAPREAAR